MGRVHRAHFTRSERCTSFRLMSSRSGMALLARGASALSADVR